jgi:hypothetical protein
MMALRHPKGSTRILIGIDDTDDSESTGTGCLAQRLVGVLRDAGLGSAVGITRHQLLIDPRIPYTSHNSSACIAWAAEPEVDARTIVEVAGQYLEVVSATESDPGLAVAVAPTWSDAWGRQELVDFGYMAKNDVLDRSVAITFAESCDITLSAHGDDGGGVIGALAALALHVSGDDGRFVWMPGLRELQGLVTYEELRARAPINEARDMSGREPRPGDVINLGDWVRPVLRKSASVLLLQGPASRTEEQAFEPAQRSDPDSPPTWAVLSRDVVQGL